MVTLVGTQSNFIDALIENIELELDAIEAYNAAIDRLDNEEYRNKFIEFKRDHDRHVKEISAIVKKAGKTPPDSPGLKAYLTKGKVILTNLIGDEAILKAMKTNEDDTNKAYERLTRHDNATKEAMPILEKALNDERKQRRWIEDTLAKSA